MPVKKNPWEQGSNRRRGRPSTRGGITPPTMPGMPRRPKFYGDLASIAVGTQSRGAKGASRLTLPEPAGDPPVDWPGTKPEWGIFWAFQKLGYEPGIDFTYQARLRGVEMSYYSTVDFLVSRIKIGLEIQGKFWHGGTDHRAGDLLRDINFAQEGITIIPIDETDALQRPIWILKEALAGRSHSVISPHGLSS